MLRAACLPLSHQEVSASCVAHDVFLFSECEKIGHGAASESMGLMSGDVARGLSIQLSRSLHHYLPGGLMDSMRAKRTSQGTEARLE